MELLLAHQRRANLHQATALGAVVSISVVGICSDSTEKTYISCQQDFMRYCATTLPDFPSTQYRVNLARTIDFLTASMTKPKFSTYTAEAKGRIESVNRIKRNDTIEEPEGYCSWSSFNQMKCALTQLQ